MGFKIIEARELAPKNKFIKVEAPLIAKKAKAGQFVILRIDEYGERIPLTLADWDKEGKTITLIFQEVGKTTMHLGILKAGDELKDVIGPLGIPSHVEKIGTVVCIGGGLGIAPLYPISRAFKEAGNKVISIIGARSENLLFWEEELKSSSDELLICTDDGSKGMKGLVTDVLKEVMAKEKINLVFAIGPSIMMKVVAEATMPAGIKTIVSLNPVMMDGTGMCGACRVSVDGTTKFACVDGPDFDAHLVDFDLLMARQKMFLNEEKKSTELYLEKCKACSEK